MRDWLGFKRRRAAFRAEVLAAVTPVPATSLDIARRMEAKRGRMVGVGSLVMALHDLTDEGTINRSRNSEHPEYWRAEEHVR